MDFDDDPEYLDIDDILAQTQSVNCKFLFSIPGLDFLSPGNSQEVNHKSNLLLPFWMAKTLYTYSMIDIELPRPYTEKFYEVIQADPDVIDLHRAGPYYYRFGKLLMGLRREKGNNLDTYTEEGQRNKFRREEGETLGNRNSIADGMMRTFHHRRHKLINYSINPRASGGHTDVHKFESRLDNMEKKLFQLGRQQVEEIKDWKSRRIELISNNMTATRLSKRRKIETASSTNDVKTK